jgi:dienelactone hydrolase
MDGPFKTVQDLMSGPKRASGLFRPMELGKDGIKHPIFLFGCGGGSNPATYAPRLNRIASHGFVVLADVQNIGDNEKVFSASLDWLLAENMRADSPLFGKLDSTKIGAGGHSIGSVNAFFFAPDPRLTTTIHVAGGSLDNVNDPNAMTTGMGGKNLKHPSAFITGDTDQFGNIEKAAKDYAAATVPVFFTQISGTDHIAAVEQGLPVIVAWLRWQLAGETERRSQFLDPMGEYNTGRYKSQSKNW